MPRCGGEREKERERHGADCPLCVVCVSRSQKFPTPFPERGGLCVTEFYPPIPVCIYKT